jgi:hypothetical protein
MRTRSISWYSALFFVFLGLVALLEPAGTLFAQSNYGAISGRLGDQRDATGPVLNPYFDITAFVLLKDQYTVSPEPPSLDELRAPGLRSLNLNLLKTFPIRERLRLEVRMEASGVTNTPRFAAPGTNTSVAGTFGVITSAGG